MSPKELSYIEDALTHEQFLKNQCDEAMKCLNDSQLISKFLTAYTNWSDRYHGRTSSLL